MESTPASDLRRGRPWYLVAALALLWFMGMFGTISGCGTVSYLREGSIPSAPTLHEISGGASPRASDLTQLLEATHMRATAELRSRTFPLAVGRLILSGLLVVASAGAIAGRKGARSLLVQGIVGNLVFAVLEWSMLSGLRTRWAAAVDGARLQLAGQDIDSLGMQMSILKVSPLLFFLIEIAVLVAALAAVTSQRGREFFEALDRAHQRAQERDVDD